MNMKCVGHVAGLCGPEPEKIRAEIAGVFASEPACEGVKLRGLSEQEERSPVNQIPFFLSVFYQGTHGEDRYMGDGKGEDEGWTFEFNGPNGFFKASVRTQQELVQRVCDAAKGHGAEIEKSGGRNL